LQVFLQLQKKEEDLEAAEAEKQAAVAGPQASASPSPHHVQQEEDDASTSLLHDSIVVSHLQVPKPRLWIKICALMGIRWKQTVRQSVREPPRAGGARYR
jgi:hypothetical protein